MSSRPGPSTTTAAGQDDFKIIFANTETYKKSTEIQVAQKFIGGLIGRNGFNIERIKSATQTQIKVPSRDEQSNDPKKLMPVTIFGPNEENIQRAKKLIKDYLGKEKAQKVIKIEIPNKYLQILKNMGGRIKRESGIEMIRFEENPGMTYNPNTIFAPGGMKTTNTVTLKGSGESIHLASTLINNRIQELQSIDEKLTANNKQGTNRKIKNKK